MWSRHYLRLVCRRLHGWSGQSGGGGQPVSQDLPFLGRRSQKARRKSKPRAAGLTPWSSGETPWPAEESLYGTLGDLEEGETLEQREWAEAEHYSFWGSVRPRDRQWRGRTNHFHNHYDGSRRGPAE